MRWDLAGAPRYSHFFYEKIPFRVQGVKDVVGVDLAWTVLIAVGLLWPWIRWLGLGHLPGDIVVERKNFTLYVPIATGLLISVVLTLLFWVVNR